MKDERKYLLDIAPGGFQKEIRLKIAEDSPWNLEIHLFSDGFFGQFALFAFGGDTLRELGRALIVAAGKVDKQMKVLDHKSLISNLKRSIPKYQEKLELAEKQLRELEEK